MVTPSNFINPKCIINTLIIIYLLIHVFIHKYCVSESWEGGATLIKDCSGVRVTGPSGAQRQRLMGASWAHPAD